jgi:flagellar export protein FliJ
MAFRFRLASILRHRRRLEHGRALALAGASQHRDAIARRLSELNRQLVACRESLVTAGRHGTAAHSFLVIADVAEGLARWVRETGQRLAAAQGRVAAARAALVEAVQGRRVLERREDLQRIAYERRARTLEQRQVDEIAGLYDRRHRADGRLA